MSSVTGYSVKGYGEMITDRPRMSAYYKALRQAVKPGDVVVDIGAGTGIFSLLACRLGAGHVHAIEPDSSIEVARQAAVANGCADRITFHQTLSTAVNLSAPADVIISDLRGVLPLLQHHIPSIVDARARLLAPTGVLIPRRDTLWASLIEYPKLYQPYHEPWLHNDYGLDLSAGRPLVVNTWRKTNAKVDHLLVPPRRWATLDYTTIESPDVAGELTWTAERAGTAHGLLLWFDAELGQGIGFSNAPGEPELIYGQAFFPLLEPVALEPGDTVSVNLRADLAGDDYIWQWRTRIQAPNGGPLKANFIQSTFFGQPVSLDALRKKEANYRPALSETGQAEQFMLSLMDGTVSLKEIAERAHRQYPTVFADHKKALTTAGELSAKYTR